MGDVLCCRDERQEVVWWNRRDSGRRGEEMKAARGTVKCEEEREERQEVGGNWLRNRRAAKELDAERFQDLEGFG